LKICRSLVNFINCTVIHWKSVSKSRQVIQRQHRATTLVTKYHLKQEMSNDDHFSTSAKNIFPNEFSENFEPCLQLSASDASFEDSSFKYVADMSLNEKENFDIEKPAARSVVANNQHLLDDDGDDDDQTEAVEIMRKFNVETFDDVLSSTNNSLTDETVSTNFSGESLITSALGSSNGSASVLTNLTGENVGMQLQFDASKRNFSEKQHSFASKLGSLKKLNGVQEFKFRTDERHRIHEKKFQQKLKEEYEQEKRNRQFRAKPLPSSLRKPFQIQRNEREKIKSQRIILNTELRALKRKAFDENLEQRRCFYQSLKEEAERQQMEIEQKEIRQLRKQLVHKPLPIRCNLGPRRHAKSTEKQAPSSSKQ
ncbi:hypothetical protein T4B_12188, partial [Trichinella pseudospiralis]